jgi:hypothetical protein
LYPWLGDADFLVVRADRAEPLVVLPLRLAAEIAASGLRFPRIPAASGDARRRLRHRKPDKTEEIVVMSDKNELQTFEPEDRQVDNFAGYSDDVAGVENDVPVGVIKGTLIKFTNDFRYVTRDGAELPSDLELVVIDVLRIVQKWLNSKPVETVVLDPGQAFPDIDALNKAAPKEEWCEKFGKMAGPWQKQRLAYLLNLSTMDRYTFASSSVGGTIAIRDVVDRTNWMRKLRGSNIYSAIVLSKKFMPTEFGGRDRPHFIIKRWIALGPDQTAIADQSGPQMLEEPKAPSRVTTLKRRAVQSGETVEEPGTAEILDDTIGF